MKDKEKTRIISKVSGFSSALIVESKDIELARKVGVKRIVSPSYKGDILLISDIKKNIEAKKKDKKTCMIVTVKTKNDEQRLIAASKSSVDYLIATFSDWKIIPLENLIAAIHGKSKLLAFASNSKEASITLETLEIGVDGIVADTSDINEIMKIFNIINEVKTRSLEIESSKRLNLSPAKVRNAKPLGVGARVCIDTCDLMKKGEGILVGCQSLGLFLIEAEIHETPFVAPRPFRVNTGSIALYVLVKGDKTRYLSELKAGDDILIVDRNGRMRNTSICRIKIEWRPLIIIETLCDGNIIKTILQNAETIRLMTKVGSISVKDIKKGDEVLVYIERGGRHFGTLVEEEKVIEK